MTEEICSLMNLAVLGLAKIYVHMFSGLGFLVSEGLFLILLALRRNLLGRMMILTSGVVR